MNSGYGRGLLAAMTAQAAVMGSSVIIVLMAARWVSKAQLGTYFFAMVVVQIAVTLGDLGLRNTAIKFVRRAESGGDFRLTAYVVWVGLLRATVVGCLLLASASLLGQQWGILATPGLIPLLAVISTLTILQQVAISVSAARRQFDIMGKVSASCEVVRLVTTLLLLAGGYGVLGMLAGIAVGRLCLIGVFWRRNRADLQFVRSHEEARDLLAFGIWLYSASILSLVAVRGTDVYLMSVLGPVALAGYSVAMQIPMSMARLFEAARPVLIARASDLVNDKAKEIEDGMRILLGLVFGCVICLLAVSDPLIRWAYTDAYGESVAVFRVLAIWICAQLGTYMYSINLTGLGIGRGVLLLQAPQVMMLLVTLPILVPAFGAVGGAGSLLLSSIAGNVAGAFMLRGLGKHVGWRLLVTTSRPTALLAAGVALAIWGDLSIGRSILAWSAAGVLFIVSGGVRMGDLRQALGAVGQRF